MTSRPIARHTAFSSSTMATTLRSSTLFVLESGSHALTDLVSDFGPMAIQPKAESAIGVNQLLPAPPELLPSMKPPRHSVLRPFREFRPCGSGRRAVHDSFP